MAAGDIASGAKIATVAPGRWGVAVSGGADSVALLLLMRQQPGVELHVAHLDHQTRGEASAGDAQFVQALAERLGLACTVERRDRVEPRLADAPKNVSALYRACRMEFFARLVEREKLSGMLLGHHADDQAETIWLRLGRGSGIRGLRGMSAKAVVHGVTLVRPLLSMRREQLREFLKQRGETWREDASNESDRYARNRVRRWLAGRPDITAALLELGSAAGEYVRWLRRTAPRLAVEFSARELAELPQPLAGESARAWLISRGARPGELSDEVVGRLYEMAADAATAARRQFPGGITVRRRQGRISATGPWPATTSN